MEARPRVWWHWLNGAISEEGIRLDLEWMQRAGIGGVQIFNGAMPNNTNLVTPPVTYMSPAWKSAMRSAVRQAHLQGMEVSIATSPGWSATGAPFVKPQDGMKKLVWSETELAGGRRFVGGLPQPADISGPFSTIELGENKSIAGEELPVPPRLYGDSRVLAYRLPGVEQPLPLPKVSLESGPVSAEGLFDAKLVTALEIPRPTNAKPVWIRFDYPHEVTLRSLTGVLEPKKPEIYASSRVPARLEVSNDGINFRKATDLTLGAFTQNTSSFAPVTGRIFRIVFQPERPVAAAGGGLEMAPGALLQPGLPSPFPAKTLPVAELALSGMPKVARFEEKAGFASLPDYYAASTPEVDPSFAIRQQDVIDITTHMRPDGTLDWMPPKGRWRILRFGYSLTGHMNGPAEPSATGLEVDKLSAPRVRAYMTSYIDALADAVGPELVGGRGISAMLSDSIEAGFANWTEDILDQFKTRRGYDATSMLPVLTGRIVGSAAASDAFLYDFRRTLMELLAEAHYGEIAATAKARGMTVYGEALESGTRPSLGDDIAMRRHADVPMGAMWTFNIDKQFKVAHGADVKGAASAAHLYGRTYVGAESMSSIFQPWAASPRELKHVADTEFALGVNRLSIHSSVHQPFTDRVPGIALWVFGQYFNRNESWAEQARPWIDYLARNSWMLSQGRFAADVAYFYGEEAPIVTLAEQGKLSNVPIRYGYDFINADAVLSLLSVQDGLLITPSGMRYRVLQLGGSAQRMTVTVLRKIRSLVDAGAVVAGAKPISSPSLADDPTEFRRLVDELWAGGIETRLGAGSVFESTDVEAVLAMLGVQPDQEVVSATSAPLQFNHRILGEGHIWFISNPKAQPFAGEIAFRVMGREPELWDAETGQHRPLSYRIEGGRTVIPLSFDGSGSALIVFRQSTSVKARAIAPATSRVLANFDGDWTVQFQPQRGAPPGDHKLPLGSWTTNADDGIRYFSGTATYSKVVRVPKLTKGSRGILALGEVNDIAEVNVNDKSVRTLWHAPYRVDITEQLKTGDNLIRINVTNRWVNRLIGDAQPNAAKITWTVKPVYSAKAPLLPSGLAGPVQLLEEASSSK